MSVLASQLSKGVLNEMKTMILTSNIKKDKLKLTDSSQSMTEFFEREKKRYETRTQNTTLLVLSNYSYFSGHTSFYFFRYRHARKKTIG
jgi:hypothetical protein